MVASKSASDIQKKDDAAYATATDESQWQADLEAQRSIWSTRERRVIPAMEKYLGESDGVKVEIKALTQKFVCKKKRQQDFRDFQHEREN